MEKLRLGLIKILNSWMGVMFFIIALFFLHMPSKFSIIPLIISVETYVRVIVITILLFCMIVINENLKCLLKNNQALIVLFFWGIVIVISTIVNNGIIANALWSRTTLVFSLMILVGVFIKINCKKYIFIIFIYCLIVNVLNNITVFYFYDRGGMWSVWNGESVNGQVLVGNVNGAINFAFISLLAGGIYAFKYNKYWTIVNMVNVIFTLYMAIKVESIMQIIGYSLFIALTICIFALSRFSIKEKITKWINVKSFVVFDVILFLVVVPLKGLTLFNLFGIDSALHGRRAIWTAAIEKINEKPLFGAATSNYIDVLYKSGSVKTWPHTHSIFLQVPYESGFLGLAVYIVLVLLCILEISKINSCELRLFIGAMMGIFFLIMIMDVYSSPFIYLCYGIFYYVSKNISTEETAGITEKNYAD